VIIYRRHEGEPCRNGIGLQHDLATFIALHLRVGRMMMRIRVRSNYIMSGCSPMRFKRVLFNCGLLVKQ
jgi:hypothetical protein